MPPSEKPRHRSGYTAEATLQVRSACLSMVVSLGAFLDDLCVVGGFVPSLLIDSRPAQSKLGDGDDLHPGTRDLDMGLAATLLDGERYAELSSRLRQEGFEPDANESGQTTLQRWCHRDLDVTIDFLMAPLPGQGGSQRIQALEGDFGAVITPGIELAFAERVDVEIDGAIIGGGHAKRTIPVCGPAAFVVLKALAFGDRGEPKDAFDLVYVIRHTPNASPEIADRLVLHARVQEDIVTKALSLLQRDFEAVTSLGPSRAAAFEHVDRSDRANAAADAHGHVVELLAACRVRGLTE